MIVEIIAPTFTARLTILAGFCTAADDDLKDCIGCSWPWIHGRSFHEKWSYEKLPDAPVEQPVAQIGLNLD